MACSVLVSRKKLVDKRWASQIHLLLLESKDVHFFFCISPLRYFNHIFDDIRMQALSCVCYTCGGSGPQLYSCLHCIHFGCKGEHIIDHMERQSHYIALELGYGMIYCHACRDYVYDADCYELAEKHLRREAR